MADRRVRRGLPETRARQVARGEVSALLRHAGAPHDLTRWTEGKAIDQIWDECLRADWLVWLAAVEKLPLVALVDGAIACVRRVVGAEGDERLHAAIEAASDLRSNAACRRAAKACTAIAAREEKTYRDRPRDPAQWAARAAADLAEAADALLSAEAKRGADRALADVGRGAAIGVGEHVMSSAADLDRPLVFDPEDELTYGCVVAVEDAVQACVRASLAPGASVQDSDRAAELVANVLFEVIDPVRDGLKRGHPPQALVRRIPAKLYADEEAEPIAERRRPMMAVAAALIIPVGGGHYHAGQSYTGAMITLGVALQLVVPLRLAWVLLVLADAWLARGAIDRRNEGRPLSPTRQVIRGLIVVALTYALAYLAGPSLGAELAAALPG